MRNFFVTLFTLQIAFLMALYGTLYGLIGIVLATQNPALEPMSQFIVMGVIVVYSAFFIYMDWRAIRTLWP